MNIQMYTCLIINMCMGIIVGFTGGIIIASNTLYSLKIVKQKEIRIKLPDTETVILLIKIALIIAVLFFNISPTCVWIWIIRLLI